MTVLPPPPAAAGWVPGEEDEPEWIDPSEGGVLGKIHAICEDGSAVDELAPLIPRLTVSIDTLGPDGDTALHLAALYGYDAIAEALLNAGADPTVRDGSGSLPLHDACAGGYDAIVRALLKAKEPALQVNVADEDGDTPLHAAARGGHGDIVKLLLEHGANAKATNGSDETAAELAKGSTAEVHFTPHA